MHDAPDDTKLRLRAEKELATEAGGTGLPSKMPPEKMESLIHELQVHQIELKMQNDELRRVQGELEKARDRYGHLYDFAPVGYFTVNQKGFIHEANLTLAAMLGVDRSALIGRPFTRFVLNDDQDTFYKHRQQLLETETPQSCELRLVKKDGRAFYARLECTVITNGGEGGKHIRAAVSDISDRKQAEESLQGMKNRLESLWNITKIADAEIKTISDRVLTEAQKMTDSKYAFYGFISEDEKTMALHAWSQETHSDCNVMDKTLHFQIQKAGIWADAVRKRQVVTLNDFQTEAPGKKGLPHGHVALTRLMVVPLVVGDKVLSIAAVANKQGEYTEADEKQMQAFLRNVQILIDRKNAEEEKLELMSQLQHARKMEVIGTLAGGIAHDYNNLLTVIIGNLDMARDETAPHSVMAGFLHDAELASFKARNLTDQFLTLSRGGHSVKKPGSIKHLLKEIFVQVQAQGGIECDLSIQDDLWSVAYDSKQMYYAISNVLMNAVEAMPQGGTVTIQAENKVIENKAKEFPLLLDGGAYVRISIRDEGKGIPGEHLNQIFDPYFSTKERGVQKGMGMGLTTAYAVVQKHGGHIMVNPITDVGTTVTIYLPATAAESKAQRAERPELGPQSSIADQQSHRGVGGPEASIPRILVMDDEEMLRTLAQRMLERLEYKVETVKDGAEAIETYKKHMDSGEPFDGVILDLTIKGGMGGVQAIKELIKIDPGVKAIVCSGYFNDPVLANYEEHGFRGALAKPYQKADLESVLKKVLG